MLMEHKLLSDCRGDAKLATREVLPSRHLPAQQRPPAITHKHSSHSWKALKVPVLYAFFIIFVPRLTGQKPSFGGFLVKKYNLTSQTDTYSKLISPKYPNTWFRLKKLYIATFKTKPINLCVFRDQAVTKISSVIARQPGVDDGAGVCNMCHKSK